MFSRMPSWWEVMIESIRETMWGLICATFALSNMCHIRWKAVWGITRRGGAPAPLHVHPYTLYLAPWTLHPKPCTLYPLLNTPHPALAPTPYRNTYGRYPQSPNPEAVRGITRRGGVHHCIVAVPVSFCRTRRSTSLKTAWGCMPPKFFFLLYYSRA